MRSGRFPSENGATYGEHWPLSHALTCMTRLFLKVLKDIAYIVEIAALEEKFVKPELNDFSIETNIDLDCIMYSVYCFFVEKHGCGARSVLHQYFQSGQCFMRRYIRRFLYD